MLYIVYSNAYLFQISCEIISLHCLQNIFLKYAVPKQSSILSHFANIFIVKYYKRHEKMKLGFTVCGFLIVSFLEITFGLDQVPESFPRRTFGNCWYTRSIFLQAGCPSCHPSNSV